jgi:hypothetical protein
MTRPILSLLVLAISIPPLYAQGTILHTDRSGYTTGIQNGCTYLMMKSWVLMGPRLTLEGAASYK